MSTLLIIDGLHLATAAAVNMFISTAEALVLVDDHHHSSV